MTTFSMFVDGSNLMGSLQKADLWVEDYGAFFSHVFEESTKIWQTCIGGSGIMPLVKLQRTHWYALGDLDYIEITNSGFKDLMKDIFSRSEEIRRGYLAIVGKENPGLTSVQVFEKAWETCFAESCAWYLKRKEQVKKFQDFYSMLQRNNDFIDVISCGHWKVNFLDRFVIEKGLDTRLAIDIVMSAPHYDVALVFSGDADNIPSFTHVKNAGKQIGSIEIIKGHPPEGKGRQSSSRLKSASDFVVQIYETDLLRKKIATKRTPHASGK